MEASANNEVVQSLLNCHWGNNDELEENLDVAEEYISVRNSMAPLPELEGRTKKGLKCCIGSLNSSISQSRKQLKKVEPEISALTAEERELKSERKSAFQTMVAGQMNRVCAPRIEGGTRDISEGLAMPAVTFEAPPEAFNNLYQELHSRQATLSEWTCTEEAACFPEKDLLGMCPGGKPHLTDEQLEARREKKCMCSICLTDRKLAEVAKKLSPLKPEAARLREGIREELSALGRCRRLVRRFRSGTGATETEDPVFDQGDETIFEEEALVVHRQAAEEWQRLENTLQLGVQNSLNPTRGATLTFLFAAPGETQMALRRPGDAPLTFDFELGSATWFNEPILRTLRFLAPLVEQLDVQSWMREFGEPPLQVLCLTDGQDNQSSEEVRSLSGLVRELKDITGPVSGQKLYVPIAGPLKKHTALLDENNKQIPVWLAWICCGMGGQALLGSKGPKEICIVDAIAVPQLREAPENYAVQEEEPQEPQEDDGDHEETGLRHCTSSTAASRARKRISASVGSANLSSAIEAKVEWRVGHRVRIRTSGCGRAPKAAVVLKAVPIEDGTMQYMLLFDDETTATVDACQLLGMPAAQTSMLRLQNGQKARGLQADRGLLARTADPDMQRLQVLSVVNAMTQDLGCVMGKKSSKSNKVSLEGAVKLICGEDCINEEGACALEAALGVAQSSCNVSEVRQAASLEPSDSLQAALMEIGRSAARLVPEDRIVAQRFVSVGFEMLVSGGSVMPAHISDQLGPFVGLLEANAQRRMPNRGDDELEAWRKTVSQPLGTTLNFLFKKGLLEVQSNADGEMYLAVQEALPCLAAIWRYVDPSSNRSGFDDALRRAVNRFQRTRRSFSFGHSSSSVDAPPSQASATSGSLDGTLPAIPAPRSAAIAVELPHLCIETAAPASRASQRSSSSAHGGASRLSSKDSAARPSSVTRLSRAMGSRCSTPGSTASSGASSVSRLAGSTFQSNGSNCSTSPSLPALNRGYASEKPSPKRSSLASAGSHFVSP